MKDKPILFSGPMVRAILEGRKTKTRRIIKPQPAHCADLPMGKDLTFASACPYGPVGRHLWVQEAWRTGEALNRYSPRKIQEHADRAGYRSGARCPLLYLADNTHRPWSDTKAEDLRNFGDWGRYRHARFMPRWASRITLEVTGVRVERLQDITDNDAEAEGITPDPLCPESHWLCADGTSTRSPRGAFESLWQSINGPGSWEANPWVWVIEFWKVEAGQHAK